MSEPLEARNCPVCLATARELMHRHRFADGPLGNGYDVVICSDCGAAYADGIPSQSELNRYYAEKSKYTYSHLGGRESKWDFERFEATASQVKSFLPSKEARILDIGCATGGLLSVFRKQGYSNVLGVDPSEVCARTAREIHGIEVKVATVDALKNWNERFDLILMVGVLEHLAGVRDAIRSAANLLRPDGVLYCAVPDIEGLAEHPGAPYQQFSFEHLSFFSSVSLNNAFHASGLPALQQWRWTTEWREGFFEPIIAGLFRGGPTADPIFDGKSRAALIGYLQYSAERENEICKTLQAFLDSQEPIVVWGAGTLARRLLATTPMARTNIVAFVDSDQRLHGQKLAGKTILAPNQLFGKSEAILICSGPFESEIIDKIRELGLPNRLISLRTGTHIGRI
jgi:SAM-dependent methyltransferase